MPDGIYQRKWSRDYFRARYFLCLYCWMKLCAIPWETHPSQSIMTRWFRKDMCFSSLKMSCSISALIPQFLQYKNRTNFTVWQPTVLDAKLNVNTSNLGPYQDRSASSSTTRISGMQLWADTLNCFEVSQTMRPSFKMNAVLWWNPVLQRNTNGRM